jgi:hypothetical protein
MATVSPALAISIAFRVSVSASSPSSSSMACVTRCRVPLGFPAGLPLWPGLNRVSCFAPAFAGPRAPVIASHQQQRR